MPVFATEYPQFFTAGIKGWYKLPENDKYKDIIVNSLRFLVEDKRIKFYAFEIMTDHMVLCQPESFCIPVLCSSQPGSLHSGTSPLR